MRSKKKSKMLRKTRIVKKSNIVKISLQFPKTVAKMLRQCPGGVQGWVDAHLDMDGLLQPTEAVIIGRKAAEISPDDF